MAGWCWSSAASRSRSTALVFDAALLCVEGWALDRGWWWGPWLVVFASGALVPFELVALVQQPPSGAPCWCSSTQPSSRGWCDTLCGERILGTAGLEFVSGLWTLLALRQPGGGLPHAMTLTLLLLLAAAPSPEVSRPDTRRLLFEENLQDYFRAEIVESWLFVGLGAATIGTGTALLTRDAPALRGAGFPLVAVGLIQALVDTQQVEAFARGD